MLQKRHILIFAIPGGIILILISALVIFEATKPKATRNPISETIPPTANVEVKTKTTNEIPLYTQFGQPLKLGLYANPTTGFQWNADFDTGFFKLLDSYYVAKGDEKLVGSGGTQYFEFEILKSGESDIHFEYKKPWEMDVSPEQTTIYKVNVSEASQ